MLQLRLYITLRGESMCTTQPVGDKPENPVRSNLVTHRLFMKWEFRVVYNETMC